MSHPLAKTYEVEGALLLVADVAQALPHLSYSTIKNRLQHGKNTWADLGAPKSKFGAKPKSCPHPYLCLPPPCPLNAAFRDWSTTTRGRALNLLDVRTDPLRGAL
jgi:hypothetical protein